MNKVILSIEYYDEVNKTIHSVKKEISGTILEQFSGERKEILEETLSELEYKMSNLKNKF
jgi:hypothetical protein